MENPFKAEIDALTEEVRRRPDHIVRWQEKEAELKKTPELFLRHRKFFTEDFVFEPGEDIMVYPDFNYPLPPRQPWEPPEFSEPVMHSHEFFEMFYVYSGVCECLYEDQVYTLRPGSLCVFNTRCRHRVHNIGGESRIYNIMLRRRALFSDMLPILNENDLFFSFFIDSLHSDDSRPNVMLFELEPGEPAELYIFNLIREYRRGQANSQSLMKLMYAALLVELSRKYMNEPRRDTASPDFARIMAYISENWSQVTLKGLCAEFRMSQSGLSRLFKEKVGTDFSEYIRRFRMDRAARLLTRTGVSIDKVAEICGYSERSSFEKEFKKYIGQTPKQYRTN